MQDHMPYIQFSFFVIQGNFPLIVTLTESSLIAATAQVAQVATSSLPLPPSPTFSPPHTSSITYCIAIVGSKWQRRRSHLNLPIRYLYFQLAQHFDGICHGIQANNVATIPPPPPPTPLQVSYDKQQQQCDHNNSNENLNRTRGAIAKKLRQTNKARMGKRSAQ